MSPYRFKYTYDPDRFGSQGHSWSLIGALGAVELNVTVSKRTDEFGGVSGGIEVHSRTPLYDATAPSHDKCHLLHQPCWHDGSSLWVEENIKPHWHFPETETDHRMMFNHLERWYKDKFNADEDES